MAILEIAASLASIVGLLAEFTNQRRVRSDGDYKDFVAWLSENRHAEVVQLLEQNANTAISVKALLNEDRTLLHTKLGNLDRQLAVIASGIEGLKDLAKAIRPDAELSRQAIRILREFDASGAGKALDSQVDNSRGLLLFDGGSGEILLDDVRFADDDLETLVELRFLRLDYNAKGDRILIFTRYASEYIKTLARDA